MTDEADAAITADELGAMRLWPTLDGARPAVPVDTSSQPDQLALLHDGRDLVAVVLDGAGNVMLTRLGLDGTVYGRAQLAGGSTFEEVAAVGRQVIARTNDSAVELYDADGTFRGRVVAGPGERISDLATRRGRAAVVVSTPAGSFMRWATVGAHLAWGTTLALPLAPRDNLFAIAPKRDRIAFVDVGNTGLHVLDLDTVPTPAIGPNLAVSEATQSVGFIDDETIAALGAPTMWWAPNTPSTDPWAVPDGSPQIPPSAFGGGGVGDGRIVVPVNLALALSDTKGTHYLGWKDMVSNSMPQNLDQIVLTNSGYQFNWLDDNLQSLHTYDVLANRGPSDPWMSGMAIGPHHLLRSHPVNDESTTWIIDLVDTSTAAHPITIGRFPRYDRHDFDNGMLSVIAAGTVRRFKLDLDTDRVTELMPTLTVNANNIPSWFKLFDPEKADGLAALALVWDNENSTQMSLLAYRQVDGRVAKTTIGHLDGMPLRIDEDGSYYTYITSPEPAIVKGRDGAELRRIPMPGAQTPIAISQRGDRFAFHVDNDVVVVDTTGHEMWRQTIWGANTLDFIAGGTRLGVLAPGGVLAFETDTGKLLARECGWSFGIHDKPPDASGPGTAPVCEDPIVQ